MTLIQSFAVIVSIILMGVIFRRANIFNQIHVEGFGIFLLLLAMPCYLFVSTIQHDLTALLYPQYIYSYLVNFVIICVIVGIFYRNLGSSAAISIKMLAAGYPNTLIYALPIITFLLKNPTAGIVANVLQIIIIQAIFILILSLIRHKEKSLFKKIVTVLTTPIILAPALGMLCNYYRFTPPSVIMQIVKHIGDGASSIALFAFGLNIAEVHFGRGLFDRSLLSIVFIKNIVHPVVACIVGRYIFNLQGYWLYSLIIVSSAPTAFIVFLLAKQYQIEYELMKKVVAVSSIFSLISLLFITIYLQSL